MPGETQVFFLLPPPLRCKPLLPPPPTPSPCTLPPTDEGSVHTRTHLHSTVRECARAHNSTLFPCRQGTWLNRGHSVTATNFLAARYLFLYISFFVRQELPKTLMRLFPSPKCNKIECQILVATSLFGSGTQEEPILNSVKASWGSVWVGVGGGG